MKSDFSTNLLSSLSECVAAQTGLHFPRDRWTDLKRGISSAAQELGFDDPQSCIQWLLSSPLTKAEVEILASHLTVGETFFLRDRRIFEFFEEEIIPELIRKRQGQERYLRIWSAGCCTGEEPYSIAICLSKTIAAFKDWKITILGTDINPRFLEKAAAGEYGQWSFRGAPPWLTERFFYRTREGQFALVPKIKDMVTFSYLNLAEDVYPSLMNNTNGMDVIFCRNVLMYLAPEQAKKILQNFHRCLVDGGWLIVGPSETTQTLCSQFRTVSVPGATLFRKGGKEAQLAEMPWQAAQSDKCGAAEPSLVIPPQTVPEKPLLPVSMEPVDKHTYFEAEPTQLETKHPQPIKPAREPYLEALKLYEQGIYEQCIERLSEMFANEQENSQAISLMARACANQGKLSEALEWCEKAIAADKLNPYCYYLHANILQEQGAVAETISSLKKTLYLDQNFVLAHFTLGNIARKQGRHKEAAKHFDNALLILSGQKSEEILPESEGLTAARLAEIITSMQARRD